MKKNRRQFLRDLGISAAAGPFLAGLPELRAGANAINAGRPRQRMVFMFSPNGTLPNLFWPDGEGTDFEFKRILEPLQPFKKQTLLIKGLCNKVRGDGDGHMRGMSCLLTGIELFPGNIQGGSDTPAGWPKGPSIDQELKHFLQSQPETRTRFGSLEFGVGVPNRADPWTRWNYAAANQPVGAISDPYEMFEKLYGPAREREHVASILDNLRDDLKRAAARLGGESASMLEKHVALVRELEVDLEESAKQKLEHPLPRLEQGVSQDNDELPKHFTMQTQMLVNAFANDMTRIASLQYTNSVGQAKARWLGIEEGHHSLSHDPDLNEGSQEKLAKINVWLCQQLAVLAQKLADTPEPGGGGSMLDHTTILWTNELGKGNSHTLDNIPFVLVGGGLGFATGRSLKLALTPHNRLWMSVAHAFGHEIKSFGNPKLCEAGPLALT